MTAGSMNAIDDKRKSARDQLDKMRGSAKRCTKWSYLISTWHLAVFYSLA